MPDAAIRDFAAKGIILSGGPETVTVDNTTRIPAIVFELNVPLLGICYGMQAMAQQLGGAVEAASKHEFGYASVEAMNHSALLDGIVDHQQQDKNLLDVWMSHGDKVSQMPAGFCLMASTPSAPI